MAVFTEISRLPADDPGRAQLRDQLVTRCLPLAEHLAWRFTGRGEPHDDLLQVARLGLVNAVDRFDVDHGADFVSFAVPTIMGEIRRHFRDTSWAMRVPRRLKELHVTLSRAAGEMSQRLGRAPTVRELSDELDLSVEEVSEGLVAGNAYQTVSVDAETRGPDTLPLRETLGELDEAIMSVEDHESLRPLLEALPERERTVLMLRFFGNMTQSQIAERVGVSQMHVSRILARTLAQLRRELE
nr:SigB/SigF/SigG family RNA polymerase sigma factor [Skermania piniformis]